VQIGVVIPAVLQLKVIAAAIIPIRDVHRLMKVLNQVNKKP
jgi:hypothetical protein